MVVAPISVASVFTAGSATAQANLEKAEMSFDCLSDDSVEFDCVSMTLTFSLALA